MSRNPFFAKRDMAYWRRQIDAIDDRLLRLLNRRASCAIQIGRLKRSRNLEIYSPEREAEILNRVTGGNRGPLTRQAIRHVFERIIDESRSLERMASEERSLLPAGKRARSDSGKNAKAKGRRMNPRWSS